MGPISRAWSGGLGVLSKPRRSFRPGKASGGEGLGPMASFLVMLALALLPVYLLPSGSLQLVDPFLLLLMAVMAINLDHASLEVAKEVGYLLPFVTYAVLLNLLYFAWNHHEPTYLKKAAELLYVTGIFCTFTVAFGKLLRTGAYFPFLGGLALAVALTFATPGNHDQSWVRNALSFNNPNQMGYFAVLLLSHLVLLKENQPAFQEAALGRGYRNLMWWLIGLAHLLAVLSVSKAALAAMVLLDLYLLRNASGKARLGCLAGMLVLVGGLWVSMPDRLDKVSSYLEAKARLERVEQRFKKNWARVEFGEDWQWLVGNGAGHTEAVGDNLEVHTFFGAILKSYGLVGLGLIAFWFGRLLYLSFTLRGGLAIMLALLLYNCFHNGSRFRFFWIFCAFLVAMAASQPLPGEWRNPWRLRRLEEMEP